MKETQPNQRGGEVRRGKGSYYTKKSIIIRVQYVINYRGSFILIVSPKQSAQCSLHIVSILFYLLFTVNCQTAFNPQ